MNLNDRDLNGKESSIAKLVMDRIRKEDPWAFPSRNHFHIPIQAVRWLTALGLVMLTLSLFFIFSGFVNQGHHELRTDQSLQHVVGVEEIGYADSSGSALNNISLENMVASIGEAFVFNNSSGEKSLNFPLLIAFFIFFEVLLLMNWINRNSKI